MFRRQTILAISLALAMACGSDKGGECADEHDHGHEHEHEDACGNAETEVISRVVLTFTPAGGGAAITAQFDDPDGDGGVSGTTDPITLATGMMFTLDIEFLNALEDPPEAITEEIEAEAEDHFVLVLGSAVSGPASMSTSAVLEHAYADVESDYGHNDTGTDLPVGLQNTVTTVGMGTGDLRVTLRHLPPLDDGTPQKTDDVPAQTAMGAALPGEADVDVTFAVTVQ